MRLREAIAHYKGQAAISWKYGGVHAQTAKWLEELQARRKADGVAEKGRERDRHRMPSSGVMDSNILDNMDDVAEARRKASKDPHWTPADIAT